MRRVPKVPPCNYCGGNAVLRDGKFIGWGHAWHDTPVWACENWPRCTALVSCHPGTNHALGTMADRTLRELRKAVHIEIDRLWKPGMVDRQAVYAWLARLVGCYDEFHVGGSTAQECQRILAVLHAKQYALTLLLAARRGVPEARERLADIVPHYQHPEGQDPRWFAGACASTPRVNGANRE